ncbi:MAG: hypothetical protein HUK25_03085 [Treponema sp.]|nr:hypothetical protein [Treponema sp.]
MFSQDSNQNNFIFSITGIVIHGKGRGRTVGMPTANLSAEVPQIDEGVYASSIFIENEKFLGVTNIGHRPTVDEEKTIETHILDFDRDIYGKTVTVNLIKFLRGIKKFNSLDEVKKQVQNDIEKCREIVK